MWERTITSDGRSPSSRAFLVVVVEVDELAQAVLSSYGGSLRGHTLHEVTIRADAVNVVVYDLMPYAVVPPGEESLGHRHPDAVGEALPQRSGRGLHTGGMVVLGVARCARAPLAKVLYIFHR